MHRRGKHDTIQVFPVHDRVPNGLHVHWGDARRVRLHLERILTVFLVPRNDYLLHIVY